MGNSFSFHMWDLLTGPLWRVQVTTCPLSQIFPLNIRNGEGNWAEGMLIMIDFVSAIRLIHSVIWIQILHVSYSVGMCLDPGDNPVHLNEYKEWMPGKNILEGSMWLAQQPAMRSQNVLMFPSELPARMPNIILFLALDWPEYSWCGV